MSSASLSAQHKKVRTYFTNKHLQSKGLTFTYPIFYDIKSMPKNEKVKFGDLTKKEKEWKYWHQNGQLARIENYKLVINKDPNDLRDGKWIYYNYQGVKYKEDIYKDGKLITGETEIYCDTSLVGKIVIQNGIPDTILSRPLKKPQNLILNPDFDFFYYKPVPIVYHGQDQLEDWIPSWTTPGNYTPDYISNYRFIDLMDYHYLIESKLPDKYNYIGLALFKDVDDYSEYIQGRFNEPLESGVKYCLRISINSTSYSKYLVDRLGCYFSNSSIKVDETTEDTYSPQIIFSYLPTEAKEFVSLCKYFSAKGGENYITLGRFIKKSNLSVFARDKFPMSQFFLEKSSYYLIDKIELFKIKDTLDCYCRVIIDKTNLSTLKNDTVQAKIKMGLDTLKPGNIFILKNINFDFNSYILLKSSEGILNLLLEYLNENPSVRILINGHTDDIGTDEYNLKLSIQRAKSVYNWLVDKGINPSRLKYIGFGKRKPLVISTEEKNRDINRRVEMRIIEN